jgi:hypothetical protein
LAKVTIRAPFSADQDRPGDELERRTAALISERAAAHVRQRIVGVPLHERYVGR